MRYIVGFFRPWLLRCFVLAFFVAPLYLIAIYPEVPAHMIRLAYSFNHGVVRGEPSLLGFLYRLMGCGLVIGLGILPVRRRLLELTPESKKHRR